jgi:outer membrane protein OmpU
MNNLKKIGLSALAGSLVAVSANAGEFSVSGSAEFTYNNKDGSTGSGNNINGDPYSASEEIKFSGSGDVGFGELTVVRVIGDDGSSTATSYSTLDMGDLGTIGFDSAGGSLAGTAPNDDLLPTAYEEASYGVSSDYVSGAAGGNTLSYANSIGPVSFSAAYDKSQDTQVRGDGSVSGDGTTGSTNSYYASVDMGAFGIDGLTLGAGHSETTNVQAATDETTYAVGHILYTMGNISVGYRQAQENLGTAAEAQKDVTGFSIAFNVNENLAISYGEQTTDKAAASGNTNTIDEEVSGISAAYTMGAATIRIVNNVSDNDNFVQDAEEEVTEISLVLSF